MNILEGAGYVPQLKITVEATESHVRGTEYHHDVDVIPRDSITLEFINSVMEQSKFEASTLEAEGGKKVTLVFCTLPNGFLMTETSTSVNPDFYSLEVGTKICKDNIKEKLWGLYGFLLQSIRAIPVTTK